MPDHGLFEAALPEARPREHFSRAAGFRAWGWDVPLIPTVLNRDCNRGGGVLECLLRTVTIGANIPSLGFRVSGLALGGSSEAPAVDGVLGLGVLPGL